MKVIKTFLYIIFVIIYFSNCKANEIIEKQGNVKEIITLINEYCPRENFPSIICQAYDLLPQFILKKIKDINYKLIITNDTQNDLQILLSLNLNQDKSQNHLSIMLLLSEVDISKLSVFLNDSPNLLKFKEQSKLIFRNTSIDDAYLSGNIIVYLPIKKLISDSYSIDDIMIKTPNSYPVNINLNSKSYAHKKNLKISARCNNLANLNIEINFFNEQRIFLLPILSDLELLCEECEVNYENSVYLNKIYVNFENLYFIQTLMSNISAAPMGVNLLFASDQVYNLSKKYRDQHYKQFLQIFSDYLIDPNRLTILITSALSIYKTDKIWHYLVMLIKYTYLEKVFKNKVQMTHSAYALKEYQTYEMLKKKYSIRLYQLYLDDFLIEYDFNIDQK